MPAFTVGDRAGPFDRALRARKVDVELIQIGSIPNNRHVAIQCPEAILQPEIHPSHFFLGRIDERHSQEQHIAREDVANNVGAGRM